MSNAYVTVTRRARQRDEYAEWLRIARELAYGRARAAGRSDADASDVSQQVVEYALRHGRAIMTAYPNPRLFAAVRTGHAGVAWARREGVQCGQGAVFGRAKETLHAELGDGQTLADTLASYDDTAEAAVQHLRDDAVRLAVATSLDTRTARWVWDVKGYGMTVADVARRDGVTRETVSRVVNRAVGTLQAVLGDFLGG